MKEKYKIISGSGLKLIAVICMLIDHTAGHILKYYDFATDALIRLGTTDISLYFIMRRIGRISFPIFAFLIAEGYVHTKNKKKYGLNLLASALISEIPWNLCHGGELLNPSSQNVLFTLLLGYLAIVVLDYYKDDKKTMVYFEILLFLTSVFIKSDYGSYGMGLVVVMYLLRENKIMQFLLGSCMMSKEIFASLAFVPINMYNGKRGFIKGKAAKYFFYIIYPLQYFIIYLIKMKLQIA